MRCPCCGSEDLVWDFATGSVVCTHCGCVVDVILVYSSSGFEEAPSRRRYRDAERLYSFERALTRKRAKEAEKVFELEKKGFVLVGNKFIHIRSLEALKTLESNENVKKLVDEGLKIIQSVAPAMSKTIRARLALAYTVAKMLIRGASPSTSELAQLFSIGKTTAARIIREANEIIQQLSHASAGERLLPTSS